MSQPVASGYQWPSVSGIREDSVPSSSYERREWSPRPFESTERPASRETSLTLAKVTKIAFFAIGAIAVMYLIYAAGHKAGHGEGYEVGHASGIIEGKKDGYDWGHIDGKFNGWKEGYADGKKIQKEVSESDCADRIRDCVDRMNRRCGPRYVE